MLITLIVLVIALFSGRIEWQSSAVNAKATTVPVITPQDPSSLTLALIGGGMLAVYFAASRTIRYRRPLRRMARLSTGSPPSVGEHATAAEHPTRGAA